MKAINSKGISTIAIIAIIVIVLLAGGLIWWQTSDNSNSNTNNNNNSNLNINYNINTNSINLNTSIDTTGWKDYRNTDFSFKIIIPNNWGSISEYDGSCCHELLPNTNGTLFGDENGDYLSFYASKMSNTIEDYINIQHYNSSEYARYDQVNLIGEKVVLLINKRSDLPDWSSNRYIFIYQKNNNIIEFKMKNLDDVNKAVMNSVTLPPISMP